MKKFSSLLFVLIAVFAISCSDDTPATPDSENYLEITINGEELITNTGGGSFKGILEQKTCDGKAATLNMIGIINSANFKFELSLFHYPYNSDFEDSKKGTYKVGSYILSVNDSTMCNLDAMAYLEDKNEDIVYTTLMPGAIHEVTEIISLGSGDNSTSQNANKYEIRGEIKNLVFINASDEEILVSGKYQAYVFVQ